MPVTAGDNEYHKGFADRVWQVHKFGGTSVATAECFRTCANIIEDRLHDHHETHIAVVVSAMGGKPKTTDLLLDSVKAAAQRDLEQVESLLGTVLSKHEMCLKELFGDSSEYTRLVGIVKKDLDDIRDILKTVSLMKWQASRIRELVSGYGELWSSQILTALMVQRQGNNTPTHKFVYLDARRVIVIDEEAIQDGAVVWDKSFENLQRIFDEEIAKLRGENQPLLHFIMTGYVATNTEGVATTLQRDGSDYSAAILGRLLVANGISIWTDVDGVLSADPRRVPHAQVLPEVSFNEAMELSYFGAKVIHPKTMQPAISCCPQIPIYIKNTFNPNFPGSRIYTTSTTQKDGENVICAFSSIEHMAIVNVEGSGLIGVPGVAKRLFGTLERVGVNVVLISQASSEHSITFATTEAQAELAKEVIEEEFRRELEQNRISNVDITSPCSIIAAVGDGMSQTTGVSGRFFSALGDAKINIIAIAQGCSERNISAVVRGEDSTRALRAVHAAFRLSNTAVRIAIVGMSELGESLLYLLQTQLNFIHKPCDLDLQVCVVLPKTDVNEIVCLKNDTDSDASAESITLGALKKSMTANDHHASFQDERNTASKESGGPESLLKHLFRSNCTNHVIFDCTNDETVGAFHAEWIRAQVDVVTANNTGLSGSKEQRKAIAESERAYGKQSAMYLREVCVGGGLPVIKTLRSLLTSGDSIQRVDGILSVSLSYIMFRVSPPPAVSPHCRNFDDKYNNGAFTVDKPCLFSEAVRDAIQLGLMEKDPTKDLNNEYTSRVLMVLGKELGMCDDMDFSDIQEKSDKLLDEIMHEKVDCRNLPVNIDEEVKARCDAARSRGCVLRHISSVDVKEKSVDIKLVEVPENHAFAVTPPSCEIVRFFTHRHMRYPLIIQGPSAGADSTASALLAELLQLMRGKVFPRSVALTRTASGAVLQQ